MPFYKIYAGLGGGFGGASYQLTDEYESYESAMEHAYQLACDSYEMQEGSGCDGWEDFLAEAESEVCMSDFNDDEEEYQQAIEEYAAQASEEARESWVDYHVVETDRLDDVDE